MFKEKTCQKPNGSIIQADDSVNVPFGTIIVPGAEFSFLQKGTA